MDYINSDENSIDIINKMKSNNYTYFQTTIQKLHFKLSNSIQGKYFNSIYISEFINFLKCHLFNYEISSEIEKRFNLLNIHMLYMIFVIKYYMFSNLKEEDVIKKKYVQKIKEFLSIFVKEYNSSYEIYYLD
ncbi:hypothetical protein BCR32DRAFT_250568 [Anaeromyces robustus]|uniref:Uncharacterized protein n=1 Tax=Anaeromyces robustus TaxID=1754192 RepID=A0A1Y1VXR7_9FUNG|nr:hypothetical protein BCR32DRAFT_250568 [Anaeromyces robustus]|eukprot:ORX65993.1 hypothetical protein BCR32DRAFT_250568 [Anaeromyces robustus]